MLFQRVFSFVFSFFVFKQAWYDNKHDQPYSVDEHINLVVLANVCFPCSRAWLNSLHKKYLCNIDSRIKRSAYHSILCVCMVCLKSNSAASFDYIVDRITNIYEFIIVRA